MEAGGHARRAWVAGLLALGALLRLRFYGAPRSLWLDELVIANNLGARGFAGLVGELDDGQLAPFGWLWLQEALTRVAGAGELSLRASSLLAGLCSLFLMARLSRRLLSRGAACFALAGLATSPMALHYSAELKPYGWDLALSLGCTLLALQTFGDADFRRRSWWTLGAVGLLGQALSFALVFVLGGAGLLALRRCLTGRAPWVPVLLVGVSWIALFVSMQATAYAHVTREDYGWLYAYWQDGYAPLLPGSAQALAWWPRSGLRLLAGPAGLGFLAWPFLGLALYGAQRLARRDALAAALLFLPIGLTLLASGLERYPFDGRLVLFLAPAALCACAAGIEPLLARARPGGARGWSLVLIALTSPLCWHAGKALLRPGELVYREELRPALSELARAHQPGESVLLNTWAYPGWQYYAPRLGLSQLEPTIAPRQEDELAAFEHALEELRSAQAESELWVVLTHYEDGGRGLSRYTDALDAVGERTRELALPGAWIARYRLQRAPW